MYGMKKIITLFILISLLVIMGDKETKAQSTIESINVELRDLYKNIKRAPNSVPFLFDMSSHILEPKYFQSQNDSDFITKGMFLTIYEEMRSSAYDTTILRSSDDIEDKMRKRSTNDTVNISILNAEYATFTDDAFVNDGQYYNLTDSTVDDVPNRSMEPFLLKEVFLSTLTKPVSYFKKVYFRIDSTFIFSKKELSGINNRDLDPNYARWKVDFGEGAGWREFNPLAVNNFYILYPDTGSYEIKIAIFGCDPYPYCDSYPKKLSKTAIYVLNNTIPNEPDLFYDFSNVTVGLYKGCGETKGGVYIPNKPFILVEGIDLLNTRSIPVLYDENVNTNSSKKFGVLSEYNYDFYIVNFNNTHLDMRENAKGIVELIDYLKSIMNTNEQFVVFAESMGGIIARYALTYMESELYTKDPKAFKPEQMHNTRLYISNDAPHQGATVPISFQTFYRNTQDALYFKTLKKVKFIIPLISENKYWNDVLDSKSVQQLLAYHVDADGPHPSRIEFMDDLISLNPETNGYPAYCKMIAFTDGLLSGQGQLTLDNKLVLPGTDLLKLQLKVKIIIFKWMKIDLMEEILTLKAVDKSAPTNSIVISESKVLYRKRKGCLKQLFRGSLSNFVQCAFSLGQVTEEQSKLNITSNYDSDPAGIFSILSMLSSYDGFQNHYKFPFDVNTFVDVKSGLVKANAETSRFLPFGYINSNDFSAKLKITSFGFAFIPVQSAIDYDYYKTTNTPANANLLQGNLQDNLFAHTPFHVVSGFNYKGEKYPENASEHENTKNWSHGYINNTTINDGNEEGYLCREIGDHTLYLNNLDLGKRNADFKFDTIHLGVQNPNYIYFYDIFDKKSKKISFVYSKQDYFKFKEPGTVNLNFEGILIEGENSLLDGLVNRNKINITPCNVVHKKIAKSSNSKLTVYPNPFNNEIYIQNISANKNYVVKLYNVLGQIVYQASFYTDENNLIPIKMNNLNADSIYLLNVYEEGQIISNFKIIKY